LKRFAFLFVITSVVLPSPALAAPTVRSAQQEVDRLRTLAAEKFEAANETNFRIRKLEEETGALKKRESILQRQLDASQEKLARIAIARYKSDGLGDSLELLFSSDPTAFLFSSGALDVIARNYASQTQEYATNKQMVEASQFIISDRTKLLKQQRAKLKTEVARAKAALSGAEKILKSLKKEDREKLARQEADRENKILSASQKFAQSYKGDNTRGSIALKYALQQVGDIYVWAAAGPTRWDCSGLTMRAFQQAGVSLPHSSRVQVRYGKSIPYGSVKPGDLLFFGKPISHVSIYVGGGKMVQAPRPGKRVEVVQLTPRFGSKPFVGAKRL
jgi:cell wall-associated NlpC family hydrolase